MLMLWHPTNAKVYNVALGLKRLDNPVLKSLVTDNFHTVYLLGITVLLFNTTPVCRLLLRDAKRFIGSWQDLC